MSKLSRSEQSRINGAKSKGPTTAEGKFVSSMNALKTGRYAKDDIVLSLENSDALEAQVDDYARLLKPRSRVEYRLCRELAGLEWRLDRYRSVEARLLEREIESILAAEASTGRASSNLDVITQAHLAAFDRSPLLRYLAQRQDRLSRERKRTLALFTEIRKRSESSDEASEIVELPPLDLDCDHERPRANEPEIKPVTGPSTTPKPRSQPPLPAFPVPDSTLRPDPDLPPAA